MIMNLPHSNLVESLDALLHKQLVVRGLDEDIFVRCQLPLVLKDGANVEPDLVLLREGPPHKEQPLAENVDLIIEVCDKTFYTDRNAKLPRYAASGVVEVWICDVRDEQQPVLIVHRGPVINGEYSNVAQLTIDKIQAERIPELPLDVQHVLIPGKSRGPAARHR